MNLLDELRAPFLYLRRHGIPAKVAAIYVGHEEWKGLVLIEPKETNWELSHYSLVDGRPDPTFRGVPIIEVCKDSHLDHSLEWN